MFTFLRNLVELSGKDLGKAIAAARAEKKLTQKDLATQINEKPSVIQQYEQGKAIPDGQVISKMEKALGKKLPRPPKQSKKMKAHIDD